MPSLQRLTAILLGSLPLQINGPDFFLTKARSKYTEKKVKSFLCVLVREYSFLAQLNGSAAEAPPT